MGKESKLSEGFCSKHCEASGRQWIKEKFIRYPKEPGEDANIQEYDYCTPEYQNRKCKTCLARFSQFICRSILIKVIRVSKIYKNLLWNQFDGRVNPPSFLMDKKTLMRTP